jgi:lipoate synthase
MDVIEIINAWKIANNPTPKQEELAKLRASMCEVCPSKKVITKKIGLATICGECGCPISKKIFSPKFNPCPLKKWGEIDTQYISEKTTSSLI